LDMLKSLAAHAEHLLRWEGGQNNWIIVESQALASCGILFPEVKRSALWRETGLDRLQLQLRRQVWPDGVQKEVSAGYHWMSGRAFAEMLRLAGANGIALPPEWPKTVEKMTEYHLYQARPDGTLPSFNDSGSADGRVGPALRYGAEQFKRDDMKWMLTRGDEGRQPEPTSYAFLDAGIYVMRSDWSASANWLAFRGGNIGAGHMHEDRLGFDLAACGSPMLVDPGAANYKPDEWRAWSLSTAAHNSATIDGLGQSQRGRSWEERAASVREINYWASDDGLDLAAARYTGPYGNAGEVTDVAHQREIHFVKPGFWVLIDVFDGQRPHTANLLFHFMPMIVVLNEATRAIHTRRLNNPNLEILPVNWPRDAVLSLTCGSRQPTQGWTALRGEWVPSPCVRVDIPFAAATFLITLLIPLASGLTSGFQVSRESDTSWRVYARDRRFLLSLQQAGFDARETPVVPIGSVSAEHGSSSV